MEHLDLLSLIFSRLHAPQDLISAASVCHSWNQAFRSIAPRLSVRSRQLFLPCFVRFPNIRQLDLGHCCDLLEDSDLETLARSFRFVECLSIGHPDCPQSHVTDSGLRFIVGRWARLTQIGLSYLPLLSDAGIGFLVECCPLLRSVSLRHCPNLGDASIESIVKNCICLQELTLEGNFQFTPPGLAVIGVYCSTLQRMCIESSSLNVRSAVTSISNSCPHIREISLKVESVNLEDVARCTTLTCLRVETAQWMPIDEAVISVTSSNRNLKEVVLINQHEPISDIVVIRIIQNCHMLESLHVHAAKLTETALQYLALCKSLKSLRLDHFQSSGQGLAELGLCGLNLSHLSLISGREIRDIELQVLVQSSKKLQLLDLFDCRGLSPIGLSAISSCSNLQSLNLSFTKVDNLSLIAIASNVKCLKHLSLVKCNSMSDAGIVAQFSALESLNLDKCTWVNDEGLRIIAFGCRQLAHLGLGSTHITDKGLYHLTNCKEIRSLRIPYCRFVEGSGLVALVKSCPLFNSVVMSHRFHGSKTMENLNERFCMVHLEADDVSF